MAIQGSVRCRFKAQALDNRGARPQIARPVQERTEPVETMIQVTDTIAIAEWELTETFSRASGPGGQNVNQVASAVSLRFEAERSPNLPPDVKVRLKRMAGQRWTTDGAIVIRAENHRSQSRNREDALERLVALIRAAAVRPKRRIKTRPSLGAKRRRLDAKSRRAEVKSLRGRPGLED